MKKIAVIGCPGSGKSTFARRLCEKTGLPLYHLDAIWHRPDRTHITREEFDARLDGLLALESWVIDGNYQRTLERRIAAADTVILFDLGAVLCLGGATERLGRERADMPWVDTELDPDFRERIEKFDTECLPVIYELLERYGADRRIVIFRVREEADAFIDAINEKGASV